MKITLETVIEMSSISVNKLASPIVQRMISDSELLGIHVSETGEGTTIIDAGLHAPGGLEAGRLITEVCLGGLARTRVQACMYGPHVLPVIYVDTDKPLISLLGSQLAGWNIKVGGFRALGSGPARALALKPKHVYDTIGYEDDADNAIIVLEASTTPTGEAVSKIASDCGVGESELTIIIAPTSSHAGSVQVSGRVLEVGLHRLMSLGLDGSSVISSHGFSPVAPVHPDAGKAMGRTNDMIIYGGVASFSVSENDDERLKNLLDSAPSSCSSEYGRPFSEIFKDAGYDFYRLDPGLFAPAVLCAINVKTGSFFSAGKVNLNLIKRSIS
jgi:methenyltetrahydromethanopterin cyclohydrolase